MNNPPATSDRSSTSSRRPRLRAITKPVALPNTRHEMLELRDLLEANLRALQALHEEHRQMLDTSLRSIDGMCTGLRAELRTIGSTRAPWVRALSETRALRFVALRELVVGAHEAALAQLPGSEQPHRLR